MSQTNKALFTISCILVAISLFISIQISYATIVFEELFQSFNAEISENTKNVLEYHYLGLIAPFLALIASIYFIRVTLDQTAKNIVYALSIIAFIITVSWQPYATNALYEPIMLMETK
jgi:hypothetical protein